MKLTSHFSLESMLHSQAASRLGIKEQFEPSAEIVANLTLLANKLEVVRALLGSVPIYVSSGYRCPRLNSDPSVGGDPHSAHLFGLAADITAPDFGSPLKVALRLAETKHLEFDRLIYEYGGWCHFQIGGDWGRRLFSKFAGDKVYHPGIFEGPATALV